MNSLSSTESEDTVLANLLAYCSEHKIWISPSICLRRVPGKGLGVYTSAPLKSGDRVMHVPTSALLTTLAVPTSFVSREARKEVPVHALLAAYLAFGLSAPRKEEYARWMATWPRVSDFTWTMPMFWPEGLLRSPVSSTVGGAVDTGSGEKELPFHALPTWLALHSSSPSKSKAAKLLEGQIVKLESHTKAICNIFPSHAQALLSQTDPLHWKFIHAWSSVNSRCFYHVRAGQQPPKDSNEAMAMCPGMDLFNHTDGVGCKTTYDRKGFYATTEREYAAEEEVLLSYGPHGNDTLWCEYGFVMDENGHDGVELDPLVLSSLTVDQKKTLEDAKYLGDYSLKPEGVCWRTEVASYVGVLTRTQWHRFLEGKYDPEDAEAKMASAEKNDVKRRKGNGEGAVLNGGIHEDRPSVMAKRRQISWIQDIAKQAIVSLNGLLSMVSIHDHDSSAAEGLIEVFADQIATMEAQGVSASEVPAARASQARLRHRMCVQRWRQILKLCIAGIDRIYDGCPALRKAEDGAKSEDEEGKDVLRLVEQYFEDGRL